MLGDRKAPKVFVRQGDFVRPTYTPMTPEGYAQWAHGYGFAYFACFRLLYAIVLDRIMANASSTPRLQ
jgi:hypothetical protein